MRHHLAGGDLIDADLGMLAMYDNARQATGSVIMEQVRAARHRARRAGRALSLEDLRSRSFPMILATTTISAVRLPMRQATPSRVSCEIPAN